MTMGNEYDLSRLAYREWNEQFKHLHAPLEVIEPRPNVLQRLIAALRRSRDERADRQKAALKGQQAQTGAVAR